MPVHSLYRGILVGTRPAEERIAHTLWLVNMVNCLILSVNRLYAVAALAQIKAYGIVIAVVVKAEHCRAVGGNRVGLMKQTGKAGDFYCFQIIGKASGYSEQILILRVERLVGRIEVIVYVLKIKPRSVMRQTCDIINSIVQIAAELVNADLNRLCLSTVIRQKQRVCFSVVQPHRVVTVDCRIRHRDVYRLSCRECRDIRVVGVRAVRIKVIDANRIIRYGGDISSRKLKQHSQRQKHTEQL